MYKGETYGCYGVIVHLLSFFKYILKYFIFFIVGFSFIVVQNNQFFLFVLTVF